MRFSKPIGIHWYVINDFFLSVLAWALFYLVRKNLLFPNQPLASSFSESTFFEGLLIIPFLWSALFLLLGSYKKNLYERSRLNEFTKTFLASVVGVIIIFFTVLLDDIQDGLDFRYYYKGFFYLLLLQMGFIFLGRSIILQAVKKQIAQGFAGFNILLIGNHNAMQKAFRDIKKDTEITGWHVAGYVELNNVHARPVTKWMNKLGHLNELENLIGEHCIDKVVMDTHAGQEAETTHLLNRLSELDVDILMIPEPFDIIKGSVRTTNLVSGQFIELNTHLMADWEQNFKRLIDLLVSFTALAVAMAFNGLGGTAGKAFVGRAYFISAVAHGL